MTLQDNQGTGTGTGSLSSRVQAARTRLGWSRETLAHNADLSWSAIEQIESGRRRNARLETLRSLSRALGVSIDYLIGGGSPASMLGHQLLVYEDDESFSEATVPFLAEGVDRSEAVMAVTTAANIEILREGLGAGAGHVKFVKSGSWYQTPVAALKGYRAFLDDRLSASSWVRIVGEPVWSGRSEEEIRSWNQYESLLNLAFAPMPVTVLCPYDERSIDPAIVAAARVTHPQRVEGRVITDNPTYQDPGEFVLS